MTTLRFHALPRVSLSCAGVAAVVFSLALAAVVTPASAQSDSFINNAPFASLFRRAPQKPAVQESTEPAAKPMKLGRFMRKPVVNAASRAAKQPDGTFKKVAVGKKAYASRSKHRRAAATAVASQAVQPAAAVASASNVKSDVRVVSPDEVNEIDLAAPGASAMAMNESATEVANAEPAAAQPVVATPVPTQPVTQPVLAQSTVGKTNPAKSANVPQASATTDGKGSTMQTAALDEQRGFIVKPAQAPAAQSVVAARPQPDPEQNSWFQNMLIVLGGAFAAASAAARLMMA